MFKLLTKTKFKTFDPQSISEKVWDYFLEGIDPDACIVCYTSHVLQTTYALEKVLNTKDEALR